MRHTWHHWNRFSDRRSKWKRAIKRVAILCESIDKRHGVWSGANVAGVWWLFLQHIIDICRRSTTVTVVAQTNYFLLLPTLTGSQWRVIINVWLYWMTFARRKITRAEYFCIYFKWDVISWVEPYISELQWTIIYETMVDSCFADSLHVRNLWWQKT